MGANPTAFISYSWDDEDHKEWVLTLASRLVENGVSVKLDRWDVLPGHSLTEFMENSVRNCNFTLAVCTPNYANRSLTRAGGVGYEQQIISAQIVSGADRSRFIPIVRSGSFNATATDCALPAHFTGIHALDFRGTVPDDKFEDLLRAIFRIPRLSPPALGRIPNFESKGGLPNLRLATLEIDGWYLNSGVVSNELHPESFFIPSESLRQSVQKTDLVKLSFELAQEPEDEGGDEELAGERMWVEITGFNGPYYVGRLRNQPLSYVYINPSDENDRFVDEDAPLKYDSEVVFLPEHILDIMTAEEAEKRA
ncbi:toll/interleukin-1 receptor domain-containing protein [Brevundimonas pondensis]|uniref:toll/interleukin-1 receptor domain-containing protein n=1 Tax=Brevundimonas pondensis TaxID=2774189 RepID=UPI003208D3FF